MRMPKAPAIVEPERDTPGSTPIACIPPITSASVQRIVLIDFFAFLLRHISSLTVRKTAVSRKLKPTRHLDG